jgi:hypothetical protein
MLSNLSYSSRERIEQGELIAVVRMKSVESVLNSSFVLIQDLCCGRIFMISFF